MGQGFPIVLTADRTLTAGYRLLFDGMLAASQTTTSPPAVLAPVLLPRPPGSGLRAALAPLGLRRIEAALLAGGFTEDEVAVVDDRRLPEAIGPATRIVAISAGEPLGLGMNSSTMTAVAGGRIYPQALLGQLLRSVRSACRRQGVSPRLVLGGPGSWQLARDEGARRRLGIDHVVSGYAEDNAPGIFRALLEGKSLEPVIEGAWRPGSAIPPIRAPSTLGAVEISRGCGWGCGFCTVGRTGMAHLPIETVLADVRTNVSAGVRNISLLSEDFFRYGGSGTRADPEALLGLLRAIGAVGGLGLLQVDHASIAAIAQFSDDQLRAVRGLLVRGLPQRYPWVNVGVETACGELLQDSTGGGKLAGGASGWGDLCAREVLRLCGAGFFPLVSLVLGLPGETEDHLRRTLAWVEALGDRPLAVFPMLHAPIDGSAPPDPRRLPPLYWALMRRSYRLNFRWVPRMYWDNQASGGVPRSRMLLLQVLGRGQILQWKTLLAWHSLICYFQELSRRTTKIDPPPSSGAHQAPRRGRPRAAADAGEGLPPPQKRDQRGAQPLLDCGPMPALRARTWTS